MILIEHAARERLRAHLLRKFAGFSAVAYSKARDTSINFARFSLNDLHAAASQHNLKLSVNGAREVLEFMESSGFLTVYNRATERVYCSGPIAKQWCQDLIDSYIRCGTPQVDNPASMETAYARAKEARQARKS